MTNQDYEALKPIEEQLEQSRNGFYRGMTRERQQIAGAVFARMFGRRLTNADYTCPACMLNALKKLAVVYFAKKAEIDAETRKISTQSAEEVPTSSRRNEAEKRPILPVVKKNLIIEFPTNRTIMTANFGVTSMRNENISNNPPADLDQMIPE